MTDESSAPGQAVADVTPPATPADAAPNPWFAAAMIIGVLLLLLGFCTLWVGISNAADYSPDSDTYFDDGVGETIWGIVALGAGALLTTAGMVLGGIDWMLRNRPAAELPR